MLPRAPPAKMTLHFERGAEQCSGVGLSRIKTARTFTFLSPWSNTVNIIIVLVFLSQYPSFQGHPKTCGHNIIQPYANHGLQVTVQVSIPWPVENQVAYTQLCSPSPVPYSPIAITKIKVKIQDQVTLAVSHSITPCQRYP